MNTLDELNEAINAVVEAGNKINEEISAEIWNKAPMLIHQTFTLELVNIAKRCGDKNLEDVPEFVDMLKAIEILEKLFPKLNKKNNPNQSVKC